MQTWNRQQLLVLLNLLNIRIGGAPAWVVRGLEPPSPVDRERLQQLHRRLRTAFDAAATDDSASVAVHVDVEPSELALMVAAVGPLLEGDRLQESECHALTGGYWSDAVDLIAWMTTPSQPGDTTH